MFKKIHYDSQTTAELKSGTMNGASQIRSIDIQLPVNKKSLPGMEGICMNVCF
jgi:hypothetical protein